MAEVYLAHDEVLDRDVALKVLRPQYADGGTIERFRREARSAASLSHPNIVAVHDWGEAADGSYYIVMEYVSGGTLKELIDREGPLSPAKAVGVTIQVARALEDAHRRGMVHRDIKPQNILVTGSGEIKVTDFGIARAAAAPAMTEPGSLVGTIHYASPEQARGDPVGPASDLYSLGVVLYEMLTGEVPYDAETPIGVVMKHLDGPLRPPIEINPEIPEELNDITVRLLARDPGERYPDAAGLVEALERLRAGDTIDDPPARKPEPERPTKVQRRRSRVPWVAGGLLALVAAFGLWLLATYLWGGEHSIWGVGPGMADVPNVVDEPREEAVGLLTERGLEVSVESVESSSEDAGKVVDQTPSGGKASKSSVVEISVGQGPPPEKDVEQLRQAVKDYYEAVDREEWSYTYEHLDSETQPLFTVEEWRQKNQFFANNYPAELKTIRVATDIRGSEPVADVTVYRTFKEGSSITRDTYFVYEDGLWKHRFAEEEIGIFIPNASYEEFVAAYGGA